MSELTKTSCPFCGVLSSARASRNPIQRTTDLLFVRERKLKLSKVMVMLSLFFLSFFVVKTIDGQGDIVWTQPECREVRNRFTLFSVVYYRPQVFSWIFRVDISFIKNFVSSCHCKSIQSRVSCLIFSSTTK